MIHRWFIDDAWFFILKSFFGQKQMIFEFRLTREPPPNLDPRTFRRQELVRKYQDWIFSPSHRIHVWYILLTFDWILWQIYHTWIPRAFKKSFCLQSVQCLSHPGKLTFWNLKSAKLKRKIMKPTLLCSMWIFRGVRVWVAIYLALLTRESIMEGCHQEWQS